MSAPMLSPTTGEPVAVVARRNRLGLIFLVVADFTGTMALIIKTASSPSPRTAASTKREMGSGLNAACPPATTMGSSIPRSIACMGMPAKSNAVSMLV